MQLTTALLKEGVVWLGDADPDLGRLIERDGVPPMWDRPPGFATLVLIILEQQVSLASARAAFDRLLEALPELHPEEFLTLDDQRLKAIGFSRQKARYVRGLSHNILDGKLTFDAMHKMEDSEVRAELMQITGIGKWTADVYLLMALQRPDVWPAGDLALVKAIRHVKGLVTNPDAVACEGIAKQWKPWRSVAARILWNHYILHLSR